MERLSHPITDLPAASLADERLQDLLNQTGWAVLSVGVRGLKEFADAYGFVARDDVVRAVGMMLSHVVNEAAAPSSFVGHIDDTNFFVIITPDKAAQVQQALNVRLDEAMAFFYPRADWEASQSDPDVNLPRMRVTIGVLEPTTETYTSVEELKGAIVAAQTEP
jgi:GGDEF domain-containing protein